MHTNAPLKVVIASQLGYFMAEKDLFEEFIRSLNPSKTIFCRQTLSDTIARKSVSVAAMVTERLGSVDALSLTFDIWSLRKCARGFGCITAHQISNSGRSESPILNFKRMKYQHTGDAISIFMLAMLLAYKLASRLIDTTGNALESIVAIKKLESSTILQGHPYSFTHYKCMAHNRSRC